MSKGLEGLRILKREGEEKMIRDEERTPLTPDELIETQQERAHEAVSNYRLIAILQGEHFFERTQREHDLSQQLRIALSLLRNTPFVQQYLPAHIQEPEYQAALLVGIAKEMAASEKNYN